MNLSNLKLTHAFPIAAERTPVPMQKRTFRGSRVQFLGQQNRATGETGSMPRALTPAEKGCPSREYEGPGGLVVELAPKVVCFARTNGWPATQLQPRHRLFGLAR